MNQVYIKTKIFSGEDSLNRLEKFEDKKIWLIADGFLVENNSVGQISDKISSSNKVIICGDVVPDPPIEVVAKGVAMIGQIQPDIVIAFGGGSAIDTAKGVIYFAKIAGLIKKVKFIAIPTTSGTGSEVTSATVITDKKMEVKHPIIDDDLLPDEVILCPYLTVSVPPVVTANTGMDVLTHALEAYVATDANAYSDALAEKAIEFVFTYLKRCYRNGDDIEARSKMQEASNLAGFAFNIAGLGMNHAIAHQLGGIFHIPHGLANALILNKVIEANSIDCRVRLRYAILARKLNIASIDEDDVTAVNHLCEAIKKCQIEMEMPLTLSQCKVAKEDLLVKMDDLYRNAINDRCAKTANRVFTRGEIESILLAML